MEELELMKAPSRLVILTRWNGTPFAVDRNSVVYLEPNGVDEENTDIGISTFNKNYDVTVKGDVVSVAQQIDPDLEA